MEYIKLFEKHSDYETYIADSASTLPNVSYCEDINDVHYNPYDYSRDYLTFVALDDGTISLNIQPGVTTSCVTSVSYSTDDGETWTTTNNTDGRTEDLVITINVSNGDKVFWKGDALAYSYFDSLEYTIYSSFFTSTCRTNIQGNIMSLLFEDDYRDKTSLENRDYCFYSLFSKEYGTYKVNAVNAKNLILPATTLSEFCYFGMFYGCTNLITAPELPATTLASTCYQEMFSQTSLTEVVKLPATTLDKWCYCGMFSLCSGITSVPNDLLPVEELKMGCYSGMFGGCTSLTSAPELPATTLAAHCYEGMFYGCTSITSTPVLPATTLAENCYYQMFEDCTSLTSAPALPSTTLVNYCYQSMFGGCTSLTSAPELPATTLAKYCYQSMFNGCTNLTTTPALPATTLAQSCYSHMFYSCTSLTTAPVLPATTLAQSCYSHMFYSCSSLNYIKALFKTTPSTSYTNSWVDGVASSGTFVKNSSATWNVTGVNGIPTGWTVETASS